MGVFATVNRALSTESRNKPRAIGLLRLASALPLSVTLLSFLGCPGAVEKIGNATSGPTVLRGSHAAIGSITYVESGKSPWDRQVAGCRFNSKTGYTLSGYDAALLSYAPDAAEPRITLYGPQGTLRLSSVACDVQLKLKETGKPEAGKIVLVCNQTGYDLITSARFERCSD